MQAFSLPIPGELQSFSPPPCQEDRLQAGGGHRRLDGETSRSAQVRLRRKPNRCEHQNDALNPLQPNQQKHWFDVLILKMPSKPFEHLKHLLQQFGDLQHLLGRHPCPMPKTDMAQMVRQALPGRFSGRTNSAFSVEVTFTFTRSCRFALVVLAISLVTVFLGLIRGP